ncbi:MAG TPA: DNA-3-methyladenine glycosylase [Bacillota bacterium]|nr:DNA-3-methyladenine glycosylase [Bacillota bacterium]HOG52837.1 DNA-3-methyladenine glycosylase [Bacillota bacterium]
MTPVQEAFFEGKGTVELAKELLGKVLVHQTAEGTASGMIVETEAYLENDPACHASRGKTARNASMFGESGKAYVYFIYGKYHCFNVVTGKKGVGEAVLIRALEPLDGILLMQKRRSVADIRELTNGPGKLCIALGISKEHDSLELWRPPLYIAKGCDVGSDEISCTSRIGVSLAKEEKLRFFVTNSRFVSRNL